MTDVRSDSAQGRFLEEALVYVYIGQYVRPDGPDRAGVLSKDCRTYYSQLKELVARGDVQQQPGSKTSAYLEGFVTTPQGTEAASRMAQARLKANAEKLAAEFGKLPPRLLRYLFEEVFGDQTDVCGTSVTLDREIGKWDSPSLQSSNPTYHCMLAEREVADARDRLFRLFSESGLMVIATRYAIVQHNAYRGLHYVPAGELEAFWRDYLDNHWLAGRLWPLEFEEMHVVFHQLQLDARGNNFLRGREELERSIPVFYREAANSFLDECLKRKVITEGTLSNGAPCFNLIDRLWYDTAQAARFKKPLLDFLLDRGRVPMPPPPPPPSLVVSLAIAPSTVSVGELVTATVGVKAGDRPISDASVAIGWGDAQADTVTDAQGTSLISHRYTVEGSHCVAVTVMKAGFSTGKAQAQVTVRRGGEKTARERLLECFQTGYAVKPPDQEWLSRLQSALQQMLGDLGIKCTVKSDDFEWGPRVIRANVQLSKGGKIREVVQASEDIANQLFSKKQGLFQFPSDDEVPKSVRIESVPAKGMVGIYIPRNDFVPIPIGELLRMLPSDNPLSFSLGLNAIGQPQFSDLSSMPHLLVAGQPRVGKSVFLNNMIVCLALQNEPSRLQFVLIDPKEGLEFGIYQNLPHVLGPIVKRANEAVEALETNHAEMDERYAIMHEVNKTGALVKNIQEYNNLPGVRPLPYRVIIIDEFADLVLSTHSKPIVDQVQALAQKGPAAGIYIVICTQQPRVKVIPGGIKDVIPSRLSFRLPSGTGSRVILDEGGAEQLLGKGDMFLKETAWPVLRRFQAPLVTNAEIKKFVSLANDLWGNKAS